MVTFEDTKVASRWPSGRLRRRPRASRSAGHRSGDVHQLLRHVNILLILPTSFSHGADSAASSDTRAGAIHAESSGLSLWPQPWSGHTKRDWMLSQVA